jgi:hypothetical protein
MRQELAGVAGKLSADEDPLELAASLIEEHWKKEEMAHV